MSVSALSVMGAAGPVHDSVKHHNAKAEFLLQSEGGSERVPTFRSISTLKPLILIDNCIQLKS